MKIEQFIITRFCCRQHGHTGCGRSVSFNEHALEPENIRMRMMLLEMICMPSLLAQTNRDFKWVIVIDEALNDEDFDTLKKITSTGLAACFYKIGGNEVLNNLDWLEQYIDGQPDYVLTTNHDDDDAIPVDFCEQLQSHIFREHEAGTLPPLKFFGFKNTLQWDMAFIPRNPLGTLSPWHRKAAVTSCGFSLLCEYPRYNFNVLNFPHPLAEYYLEDRRDIHRLRSVQIDRVNRQRQLIRKAIAANKQDYESDFRSARTFHDISLDVGPNLLSNHFYNLQTTRLEEKKTGYHRVTGPESFPNVAINWDMVRDYADAFESLCIARLSFPQYCGYLLEKVWYKMFSRFQAT